MWNLHFKNSVVRCLVPRLQKHYISYRCAIEFNALMTQQLDVLSLSLAIYHMKSKCQWLHHSWRRKQKPQPKSTQRSNNSCIFSLQQQRITLSFWILLFSSIQPSKSRTKLVARFMSHLWSISLSLYILYALTSFPRASDACDIENVAEYCEIVKLIKEKKLKSVTVTIHQKDVEWALKKVFSILFYHI